MTGKGVIEAMVNYNASLTNNIATVTKTNSRHSKKVETLRAELDKKQGGGGEVIVRGPGKYCPHCKRETWHRSDDCF